MPEQKIQKEQPRMFLHTAYVPAGNSPQSSSFWHQYNGIPFTASTSLQVRETVSHIERDENGEPLSQRQRIG